MPVQTRIQDYPNVDPVSHVLDVLRVRTELFPESRSMDIEELTDATGLSELTVREALMELARWGEVYSPFPSEWVAVDR